MTKLTKEEREISTMLLKVITTCAIGRCDENTFDSDHVNYRHLAQAFQRGYVKYYTPSEPGNHQRDLRLTKKGRELYRGLISKVAEELSK